jgi:hypothetical protein
VLAVVPSLSRFDAVCSDVLWLGQRLFLDNGTATRLGLVTLSGINNVPISDNLMTLYEKKISNKSYLRQCLGAKGENDWWNSEHSGAIRQKVCGKAL